MKPIFILVTTLTIIILSLPSFIIILFSKSEEVETAEDPTRIESNLENESAITVHVERSTTNAVESVPLEQYVARVVASEMPASFELEALKAQALAARTYILQYMLATGSLETDQTITDTVQHQVYKNDEELKEKMGAEYHWQMEKITDAVLSTAGQILTYNQMPITPAFFSTSNGKTENAEDYWENALPYLVSVDSPWDTDSPKFLDQKSIPLEEVEQKLNISLTTPIHEPPMTYTNSDRVKTVELGGKTFTGRKIREAFGLQSTDFEIEQKSDYIVFTTKGYGHGIGMSQYGANGMAEEGKSYEEIVTHYYRGVEISELDNLQTPYLAFKKSSDSSSME